MLIDSGEKFIVLECGNLVLIKRLDESLLDQDRGFFNEVVLFFEQLLIFIAREWESFKGFDEELGHNKILLLINL